MNKKQGDNQSFIENMLADLDDINEGTDAEVINALNEMGVQVEESKENFKNAMHAGRLAQKKRLMDVAREQRKVAEEKAETILERVRGWGLSMQQLIDEITRRQPLTAHREFGSWSKEDLESQLVDLISMEEGEGDEEAE